MDQVRDLSRAYKDNPTLENYLVLRRGDPDPEIEVAVFGGIDALFAMEEELKRYGIEAHPLMTGVLDARPDAISELSLRLIENLVEARGLSERGETHLARRGLIMPESLIDWLIGMMLDAVSWTGSLEVHRDLIVLIRERLGGSNKHYQQSVEVHHQRRSSIWIGAQLLAQGVDPTIRRIAEILEVSPSTVSRWFPLGDMRAEAERLSALFDENGELKLPVRRAVAPE